MVTLNMWPQALCGAAVIKNLDNRAASWGPARPRAVPAGGNGRERLPRRQGASRPCGTRPRWQNTHRSTHFDPSLPSTHTSSPSLPPSLLCPCSLFFLPPFRHVQLDGLRFIPSSSDPTLVEHCIGLEGLQNAHPVHQQTEMASSERILLWFLSLKDMQDVLTIDRKGTAALALHQQLLALQKRQTQ